MFKIKKLIFLYLIFFSLSIVSALELQVAPLDSNGFLQPNQAFNYSFIFSDSLTCSPTNYYEEQIVVTNQHGYAYISLATGNFTSSSNYLCETRNGTLKSVHTIPDLVVKNITADNIIVANNITANTYFGNWGGGTVDGEMAIMEVARFYKTIEMYSNLNIVDVVGGTMLFIDTDGFDVGLYTQISNDGGILLIGTDGSSGGYMFPTARSYSSSIGTENNVPLHFATNNIIRMTLESSGVLNLLGNITADNFLGGDGFFDNIYNRDEVEDLVGGSSLELFFKNISSGISNYWEMNRTANGFPKNASITTLSATETFLGTFISPNASDLGISGLDEGIIEGHFHAKVDATVGKKSVEGWFKIYKRTSGGTETFLTSSHIILVDSTDEKEYEAHATLVNETNFDEGDRIVLKMYANLSGGGGDPTLTTYVSGNTLARATFGTVGVNFATSRDLLNFLRHDGTVSWTGNENGNGFNSTGWDWIFASTINVTGNVSATYFIGDGSQLTGDITFVGNSGFYPRRIRQTTIPASGTGSTQIDIGEMLMWEDSDDDSVHFVYNDETAGIKSVLLS